MPECGCVPPADSGINFDNQNSSPLKQVIG